MSAPIRPTEGFDAAKTDDILARVTENRNIWEGETLPYRELCLLQMSEMARLAADALRMGKLRDIDELREAITDIVAATRLREGSASHRALTIEEQLAFCRGILLHCPPLPKEENEEPDEELSPPPRAVVPDSPFFLEALELYSSALTATPLTVTAFTDVCEALSGGKAAFGLLPIEDSKNGKLFHVYELIDRFELHISHTYDALQPDGGTARLALLYRSLPPTLAARGEKMLECTLVEDENTALSDLLSAASSCGLTLRRVDALPTPYLEDSFFYHSVFKAEGSETDVFEAFLTYFMPRATVTGRYVHIKKENMK